MINCPRCKGSGKVPKDLLNRRICYDCKELCGVDYMVPDRVWDEAFPNHREVQAQIEREHVDPQRRPFVLLCLACLSQRLKRKLTIFDFPTHILVNYEISDLFRVLETVENDSAQKSATSP